MRSLAILFATTAALLAETGPPAPVAYRFDDVRSKVVLARESGDVRAQKGTEAEGGDVVRTGLLGYALIAADTRAARFEVFSSSEVRLASGTPGVLVSLERGRIKAIFDALTGDEPRLVRTPGALLAVRGTRYGVEVDKSGATALAVFEGTVAVHSGLRPEPLLVRAGEICLFSRNDAPAARRAPQDMNEDRWNRHGMMGPRPEGRSPAQGGMMGPEGRGMHDGNTPDQTPSGRTGQPQTGNQPGMMGPQQPGSSGPMKKH